MSLKRIEIHMVSFLNCYRPFVRSSMYHSTQPIDQKQSQPFRLWTYCAWVNPHGSNLNLLVDSADGPLPASGLTKIPPTAWQNLWYPLGIYEKITHLTSVNVGKILITEARPYQPQYLGFSLTLLLFLTLLLLFLLLSKPPATAHAGSFSSAVILA